MRAVVDAVKNAPSRLNSISMSVVDAHAAPPSVQSPRAITGWLVTTTTRYPASRRSPNRLRRTGNQSSICFRTRSVGDFFVNGAIAIQKYRRTLHGQAACCHRPAAHIRFHAVQPLRRASVLDVLRAAVSVQVNTCSQATAETHPWQSPAAQRERRIRASATAFKTYSAAFTWLGSTRTLRMRIAVNRHHPPVFVASPPDPNPVGDRWDEGRVWPRPRSFCARNKARSRSTLTMVSPYRTRNSSGSWFSAAMTAPAVPSGALSSHADCSRNPQREPSPQNSRIASAPYPHSTAYLLHAMPLQQLELVFRAASCRSPPPVASAIPCCAMASREPLPPAKITAFTPPYLSVRRFAR